VLPALTAPVTEIGASPEAGPSAASCTVDCSSERPSRSIETSRRHLGKPGSQEIATRMAELAEVEEQLAQHCLRKSPVEDASLHALLVRHREWVANMWGKPCSPVAYAGLADLYESHPDFRARYELLAPGLADYLPTVMRAYARSAAA